MAFQKQAFLSLATPLLMAVVASAQSTTPVQEAPRNKRPAWPDFRGPTWDGHARNAKVPLKWSEKKNVRWKTRIPGRGWSTPVISEERAFMTTATSRGHEMSVVAVHVDTGKIVLNKVLIKVRRPEPRNPLNSYASPSPVIENGRVYVHFGTYGTACLDTTTGKTIWERRNIHCDHMEGPGSSPVLYEDLLILTMDGGDKQYVIALDTKTGDTRWRTKRSVKFTGGGDIRKSYSTPILVNVEGKMQLISSGAQATNAYDPRTGKELWMVRYRGFSLSSRPVFGDGLVFLNTGYMRARILAVKPTGSGDVTDDNVSWTYSRSVPKMPSPLFIDGRLYFVSDGGVATCLKAKDGKRLWRKRLGGEHCASPVFAGGRIYFFDREGMTVVVQPGDKYKELATNYLDNGFMASPVVLGDAFLLRSKTHLYRIEEPAEKPAPRKTRKTRQAR